MRFKYETPSLFRKAAIGFTAPHRWRTGMRPWVFDNLSGIRFQLTQDEETVIRKLALAMDKRTPAPSQDAAFDYVAGARSRGSGSAIRSTGGASPLGPARTGMAGW